MDVSFTSVERDDSEDASPVRKLNSPNRGAVPTEFFRQNFNG
jgi:hypothetical protein